MIMIMIMSHQMDGGRGCSGSCRLATDTKVSGVSVGVGVGVEISTPKKVGVGVSYSDTKKCGVVVYLLL